MHGVGQIDAKATQPSLKLELPLATFTAEWKHCDRIASYIARMVSVARPDPLRYANLLSSALNEVFETVFRVQDEYSGTLTCLVSRAGVDRVELIFPCGPKARAFYSEALSLSARPDLEALYIAALLAEGPVSPFTGLLEIIVDYGAVFSAAETEPALHLIFDLPLEQV